MILQDNVSFEKYFILQEGFSDIWNGIKKYGISTMEIAKTFKAFHNRGFREISMHQGKAGIAARILLVAAYHVIVVLGVSDFKKLQNKGNTEKIENTIEFLETHPSETTKIMDELKTTFNVNEMGF